MKNLSVKELDILKNIVKVKVEDLMNARKKEVRCSPGGVGRWRWGLGASP